MLHECVAFLLRKYIDKEQISLKMTLLGENEKETKSKQPDWKKPVGTYESYNQAHFNSRFKDMLLIWSKYIFFWFFVGFL